jgi:hypothetical protein
MNAIQNMPVVKWAIRHPRLAAWIVLSVGMIVLLVIEARDVGLLVTQWIALIVACILVAGACIWIISWEDRDEGEEMPASSTPAAPTPPAPSGSDEAKSGEAQP